MEAFLVSHFVAGAPVNFRKNLLVSIHFRHFPLIFVILSQNPPDLWKFHR